MTQNEKEFENEAADTPVSNEEPWSSLLLGLSRYEELFEEVKYPNIQN